MANGNSTQGKTMTNPEINAAFLNQTEPVIATRILKAIAERYRITKTEAEDEVTQEDAEHLLDYMVGPERAAVHFIMREQGFSK